MLISHIMGLAHPSVCPVSIRPSLCPIWAHNSKTDRNDFITKRAVSDSTNLPSILSTKAARHLQLHLSPPRPHASTYDWSSPWIPDQETHHTMAGIAQLVGQGPHGWARLCGTPDSLLMTHGLLLKIGLHGGRYDPQPVTCSSEWVSRKTIIGVNVPQSWSISCANSQVKRLGLRLGLCSARWTAA